MDMYLLLNGLCSAFLNVKPLNIESNRVYFCLHPPRTMAALLGENQMTTLNSLFYHNEIQLKNGITDYKFFEKIKDTDLHIFSHISSENGNSFSSPSLILHLILNFLAGKFISLWK